MTEIALPENTRARERSGFPGYRAQFGEWARWKFSQWFQTGEKVGEESGAVAGSAQFFGGLVNPHELIQTKGLEIVDTMMTDDAVGTYIDLKKMIALAPQWRIKPATSDDERQVEIAEFVQHVFARMKGTLRDNLMDICSALEFGYSVTNIVYEFLDDGPFSGKIGLRALKTKPPHNVTFDADPYVNIKDDGIIFTDDMGREERFSPDKFVIYTYRPKFEDPYGYGDCIRVFDRWQSKYWGVKFWDIYLERIGTGTFIAKYRHDRPPTKAEMETVKNFAKNKQARSSLVITDKWVEALFHEVEGRGNDVFQNSTGFKNRQIARAVFLPDKLGFSDDGSTGSFAMANTHLSVFKAIPTGIQQDLSEKVIGEQVIRRLVDPNYGKQDAYPQLVFDPLSFDEIIAWVTLVTTALEKGGITPDLEIENQIRQKLELAEKEGEEEEKAGGGGTVEPPRGDDDPEPDDDPDKVIEDLDDDEGSFQMGPAKVGRALTTFERKVDFDGIAMFVNDTHDQFVDIWSDVFRSHQREIIDFTRKRKIITDGKDNEVGALRLAGRTTRQMTRSLQRYVLAAFYRGALEAQREIGRAQSGTFSAGEGAAHFAIDLADLPLDDIEKFFLEKGLVATPAIKRAARKVKRKAFFITDVEVERILRQSKQIIFTGIDRADQIWSERELKRLFDGYIATGEIKTGALGTVHRIETIARNQFTTAFNDGRRRFFEDPDVEDFVEAYQWSSVLDGATTVHCELLDQQVLTKEDLNAHGWPPAHHGCRAVVVPVVQGEQYSVDRIPARAVRGVGFEMHTERIAA